jgi:hypothetical protein
MDDLNSNHSQRKQSDNFYAYRFGGFDKSAVSVLRLLSELEGSYQLLKYMGFQEDMDAIDEMKKRYYKLYFKLNKEEKVNNPL